ncbi:TPA: DMT family transporter [Legionella pneumophila]|nr:DMT family transporter [Legionella pneumophila]HAT2113059.1 DMT family transporter [Legionella pneumophila]HAT8719049.1 EamA family transporter [Legionella pneumophila]
MLFRHRGILYLFLSSLIISAANPVIAKLIALGNEHLVNGRNPISFCNVLFAGNLIAVLTLILIHFRELKGLQPEHLIVKNWCLIFLAALFAGFLTPTLYFLGLMYTNVINVVLISNLQIPMTLLAGWVFLGEVPNIRVTIGAFLATLGVFAIVFLQYWLGVSGNPTPNPEMKTAPLYVLLSSVPRSGEICIFLAVVSSTASTIIGFHALRRLPHYLFSILKMLLGLVLFFFIVIFMFGWHHFADLFSPFLWEWMLFYGSVIIALRYYFSMLGMKHAKVAEVAISSSIIPLMSIVFSYLILGDVPGISQIIGGSLILFGIYIALTGKLQAPEKTKVLEKPSGFSGV